VSGYIHPKAPSGRLTEMFQTVVSQSLLLGMTEENKTGDKNLVLPATDT